MEQYLVSARKYRPARFEDVVGQQHVTTTLKNALRNKKLAQSFLFTGPRGVGKTTCARILAKVINCENQTDDFEACSACSSCVSFQEGSSFDIFELDAASNNSVEDIRNLIEQVRFAPQAGKFKVYIIDEVHMLSSSAFNAFLKTLEEPPSYVVFILATTEKHKILPTILSRCQVFDFRRITVSSMVKHLNSIAADEKLVVEDKAIHLVAQKADGALRDALSLFDRLASFSDGNISYEEVLAQLSILDHAYFFQIVDRLLLEDSAGTLNLLDEILNKGFDGAEFIHGLSAHIRDLLVCKDAQTADLLEVSEDVRPHFETQAAVAPVHFLLNALNIANECGIHYREAINKRLQVELALLKMVHLNHLVRPPAKPPVATATALPPAGKTPANPPVNPATATEKGTPKQETPKPPAAEVQPTNTKVSEPANLQPEEPTYESLPPLNQLMPSKMQENPPADPPTNEVAQPGNEVQPGKLKEVEDVQQNSQPIQEQQQEPSSLQEPKPPALNVNSGLTEAPEQSPPPGPEEAPSSPGQKKSGMLLSSLKELTDHHFEVESKKKRVMSVEESSFDQNRLDEIYQIFANEQKGRVKSILLGHKPTLEKNVMVVVTHRVVDESCLREYCQIFVENAVDSEALNNFEMSIQLKRKEGSEPKKRIAYTDKDILSEMIEKKPALKTLIENLKLDLKYG